MEIEVVSKEFVIISASEPDEKTAEIEVTVNQLS